LCVGVVGGGGLVGVYCGVGGFVVVGVGVWGMG
jgi:hypothetical protein